MEPKMISHKLKLIIPEIPKCGSCSIFEWMLKEDPEFQTTDIDAWGKYHPGHKQLHEHDRLMKDDVSYQRVLVGRNPYTRAVSAFEYCQYAMDVSAINGLFVLKCLNDVDFKSWFMNITSPNAWVNPSGTPQAPVDVPDHNYLDGGFRTQKYYAEGYDDKTLFIHLEEGSKQLSKILKFEVSLPYVNTHKKTLENSDYRIGPWEEYYSDMDIIKQIQLLYKEDFTLWGYDPNINPYTEESW
jgi:hypothetical protein